MKLKLTRLLSGIVTVLLLIMPCVPAFASSGSTYNQKIGFWQWLLGKNSILPDFIGHAAGVTCSISEDGYHHANSYQINQQNGYYDCICSYCGQKFTAYESDLQQSYTDYVGTLPATGYTSEGHLMWRVGPADVRLIYITGNGTAYNAIGMDRFPSNAFGNGITFNCSAAEAPLNSFSSGTSMRIGLIFYLNIPLFGTYRILPVRGISFSALTDAVISNGELYYDQSSWFYQRKGDVYSLGVGNSSDFRVIVGRTTYFTLDAFYPVLEIIPDSVVDSSSGGAYSVTTRPTTITGGNYGIVGDNGQITTVTNNSSIINETNNTYYNPATGNSETVTNWTYDYSDRSYNITLESGDTVTVTYGDENITIVEGDINYTIYYIIEGSGSDPDPDISSDPGTDDNCTHEWYQTGHREGNCVTSEQRTYTCKLCGKQYTETDPAPGHSWRIIQEVSTKYDDSGNLMQEGYTIYECERCGEQYKSTNDTGPPASGGGSSGGSSGTGSSGNIFSGIFGIIWDFFTFFFDFFSDFVVGGIKGFISAILDVGSDFFAILNPFDWGY